MDSLGYHKGYRYAHDFEGAYAAGESFFPENLTGTVYYHPSDRGFEKILKEKKEKLASLDEAAGDKRYRSGFVGSKVSFRDEPEEEH